MRKIVFISVLAILNITCSVTRIPENKNSTLQKRIFEEPILNTIEKNNITRNSFFIQQVEFIITVLDERKNFNGSIRFESPDKFLISLKSNTGIEFSRIFLSKDTLMINDRINRQLQCGSVNDLELKYEIPAAVLPLIFGDFIGNETGNNKPEIILDGETHYNSFLKGLEIKYIIDLERNKTISARLYKDMNRTVIEMEYDKYFRNNGLFMPGRVTIVYDQKRITLELKYKKIVYPWSGEVKFIPGKGYKILKIQ